MIGILFCVQVKRKFSSFFKSLVIELDKDLYGPDNHLVEWHRTTTTQETDGFQVRNISWLASRVGRNNFTIGCIFIIGEETRR